MSVTEYLDIDCGHCGKAASMKVVAQYDELKPTDDWAFVEHGACFEYKVCLCPSCRQVTLLGQDFDPSRTPSYLERQVLFPGNGRAPSGLPPAIERAFSAATKVRAIDANAYAVLLGRVLDKVWEDRDAKGRTLNDKIQDLAGKGEIPKRLAEMAHSLRHLRNVGAHADLGELTIEELPVLDDLCRAILEYVYTAPQLLARVQQHLSRLNGQQKGGE